LPSKGFAVANPSGGRGGGIFFVAGAMVIAAGVVAYFALGNALRRDRPGADVKIEAPKPPATTSQ